MSNTHENKKDFEPNSLQPIDLYYECVTSCSINNKGIDCLTECVAKLVFPLSFNQYEFYLHIDLGTHI